MASSPVIALTFPTASAAVYTPAANTVAGPPPGQTAAAELRGWSVRGTTLVANIRAGTTVAGPIVATIAADYETKFFPDKGIRCNNGIFVEIVTGTAIVGSILMA